ncbi:Formate dehydrogenase-O iron-sulfur subunit [Sporomusa silvacetica DSM 10669]|uniref:Formate dehydrogenase-O iron-sulfur subunit n=1 Tax=Sporomusa silvacetica DSM 10669 TaxID=1123289 RepID=A0ABZ3ISZ3_9FIRM|nr:4Fe-4S dicluster domain-containing protein [Sporomusa silvacetica]OZC15467.1 formate dehydrogenase-O iron-sulfur subunit [Sporomusa silvacetica DSM 10669]
MSVLYDASKCTACQACSVACKQWNTLPAEKTTFTSSYQTHDQLTPKTWTFIAFDEVYENNKMQWLFRKEQCMHCGEAACLQSCNHDAISHTELGFVVIDHNKCIGCGFCVTNCTFHVPRVDPVTNKAYKCTGCPERVGNGLAPACVQTCQPEALVYGKREDIMALAEARFKALQPLHPKANLYSAPNLQGINFTYILLREPKFYGLPDEPRVPVSVHAWKQVLRPFGEIAIAGALLTTAISFIKTRKKDDEKNAGKSRDQGVGKNG